MDRLETIPRLLELLAVEYPALKLIPGEPDTYLLLRGAERTPAAKMLLGTTVLRVVRCGEDISLEEVCDFALQDLNLHKVLAFALDVQVDEEEETQPPVTPLEDLELIWETMTPEDRLRRVELIMQEVTAFQAKMQNLVRALLALGK